MKRLIYKAVFNDYDRVYPPVVPEEGVDYVILTDNGQTAAPGWQTMTVDAARFETPKEANLYYRALIHRILPGYDASLYIDGNVRLLGPSKRLFETLLQSKAAIMLHRHPLRNSVSEEAAAVIKGKKTSAVDRVKDELNCYRSDGFPDDIGLGETTVMLKNHRHPKLDAAMEMWWTLFAKHATRDQLSLPYVLWKTELDVLWVSESFRDPNPYFALYPHWRAKGVNPWYTHVSARSHDSLFYRVVLALWHGQWRLQRALRRRGA